MGGGAWEGEHGVYGEHLSGVLISIIRSLVSGVL